MDQIYQALSCLAVSLFFHGFGSSSISSTMLCSVKSNYKSIRRMHNFMDAVDTFQMLMRDCTNAFYTLDRKKILSSC